MLSQMVRDFEENAKMVKEADANPIDNFLFRFTGAFDSIAVQRMMQNDEFFRNVLGNQTMKHSLI